MASTASVKSIIESIVSAGTKGITVKELTEKLNCTRAAFYKSGKET
jgi:chromosome segregation and condensation protein ScpB